MTTQAEPRTIDPDASPVCEVKWECPDKCCEAEACGRPAVERVVYLCADKCGRAIGMLLACRHCADAVTVQETALTVRRPL